MQKRHHLRHRNFIDFESLWASSWVGSGGHVGLQDRSKCNVDVEHAKVSKIITPPIRELYFHGSGASQNGSKIDGKSILRAFYVKGLFQYPWETLPEPSWTCLGKDLGKESEIWEANLAPKLESSWHSKTQKKRHV